MNELEQALAALKPSAAALDRDRLMYRLGQVSLRRRAWVWPTATALTAGAAMVFGTILWLRPPGETKVRIVQTPSPPSVPAPLPPWPSPPPETPERIAPTHREMTGLWSYGALQRQTLRFGEAGMPDSPELVDEPERPLPPLEKIPTAGTRSSWAGEH
jgi:hypothetical protein